MVFEANIWPPKRLRIKSVGVVNSGNHECVLFSNMLVKTRNSRRARYVARMAEGRNAFKHLTCDSTGKRPLGRLARR